jgi:AcrR family transcriptional regulator
MATRAYTQTSRAAATEATRTAILDAVDALFLERWLDDITLELIAARASTTVQTVIRHFKNRDGLFAAAAQRAEERGGHRRETPAPGDADQALRILIAEYDAHGDGVLRMLAQEDRSPLLEHMAVQGRANHRAWLEEAFAPALESLGRADRERRLAQLHLLTDVYAHKLLRRDLGLSAEATARALRELIESTTIPTERH